MNCAPQTCPPLTEAGPRGAQGPQGAIGNDGLDGHSAFTTVANTFTMPAVDAPVDVVLTEGDWIVTGQMLFIESGGYFKVGNRTTNTEFTLLNAGYTGNASEGSSVLAGKLVSPAGIKGNDATEIPRGYIKFTESRGTGQAGGTFTAGSWITRQLNQRIYDTKDLSAIPTGGRFSLKGGHSYIIRGEAPAAGVERHMARLWNFDANISVGTGTSEYSHFDTGILAQTRSIVITRVTLNIDTAFELQHRCQTTRTTNGLGVPSSLGPEIYSVVEVFED